jgi:hypothetical protein
VQTSRGDPQCAAKQCVALQKKVKDLGGLGRDELAADLVARVWRRFEEQYPVPASGCGDRRRRTGWTGPDYGQVERAHFHTVTAIR